MIFGGGDGGCKVYRTYNLVIPGRTWCGRVAALSSPPRLPNPPSQSPPPSWPRPLAAAPHCHRHPLHHRHPRRLPRHPYPRLLAAAILAANTVFCSIRIMWESLVISMKMGTSGLNISFLFRGLAGRVVNMDPALCGDTRGDGVWS